MNNCAESQTKVCKAYISDCYGHLARSVNVCISAERQILKKNIFDMFDRMKMLLNNETFEDENNSAENTEEEIS